MCEADWQNVCKDNKSRAEHILQKEILTDCKFLVGQESESDKAVTIRGHKLILAIASPVFERMFYGSFDDEKSNEIRIPDIKHNIFHMMMEYIYFEGFPLMMVEDAIELYAAAKKYMLLDLMKRCVNYLHELGTISKKWEIYEFALFSEEKDLIRLTAWWIAVNASLLLKNPGFLDVNLSTALNKYALANGYFDTTNSVTNKEAESEIGKRKLLREALKRIRFLCLAPEQLEIVAKSGLLTESEVLSISLNINNPDITDCPMPEGFSNSRTPRQVSFQHFD